MGKLDLSSARLLSTIQTELLPDLRELESTLVAADHLKTSRPIQESLARLRKIIPRLASYQSGPAKRFWNKVDHRNGHMIWLGEGREGPDGVPVYEWMGKRTTAARVAWTLITNTPIGDRASGTPERLKKICDEPRCIAPLCHRKAVVLPGRVSAVTYDEKDRPCCPRGHVLHRAPRPRETIQCILCKREKEIQLARRGVQSPVPVQAGAPVYIDPDDTPDKAPLLMPAPNSTVYDAALDLELAAVFANSPDQEEQS